MSRERGSWRAANLQAQHHVVDDGTPWQQQILLKHVADVPGGIVDPAACDLDMAARRLQQTGDGIEERGLAASRRSDNGERLALL